jgi:hypothetical protein
MAQSVRKFADTDSSFMLHASSLRVVGQALEPANVAAFDLEKHGDFYVVWSESLTDSAQWISRYGLKADCAAAGARTDKVHCSLCFSRSDIARLDSYAVKRRRKKSSAYVPTGQLSQLLRTVGDHLDRHSVVNFHLSWTADEIRIVTLPSGDLILETITLTREKLRQLSLHTRLRRSKPSGSPALH